MVQHQQQEEQCLNDDAVRFASHACLHSPQQQLVDSPRTFHFSEMKSVFPSSSLHLIRPTTATTATDATTQNKRNFCFPVSPGCSSSRLVFLSKMKISFDAVMTERGRGRGSRTPCCLDWVPRLDPRCLPNLTGPAWPIPDHMVRLDARSWSWSVPHTRVPGRETAQNQS